MTQSSPIQRATVSYNPSTHFWSLIEDYSYVDKKRQLEIAVYKHSEYDLSSIPRFFWRVIAPFELSLEAPLIHDYLYVTNGGRRNDPKQKMRGHILSLQTGNKEQYTRKEADLLFRTIMEQAFVSPLNVDLAYSAVTVANLLNKWE